MLKIFRWPFLWLIKFYQITLSPDHGLIKIFFPYGVCKYYPTCSQYGFEAIKRYGIFKGGCLAIKRIMRCHPWAEGGIDLVPEKNKNF